MFLLLIFDLFARNPAGSSIYSSEKHQKVKSRSSEEWDQYRIHLRKNMEKLMGELPDRTRLPAMDIMIKDTLRTDSYTRMNIEFTAAENERVPAYLYLPHTRSAKPARSEEHPTGAEGKKIVDGQGRENRGYAKERDEQGECVIAP